MRRGKPTFVDAVVDVWVDPLIHGVNVCPECLGVETPARSTRLTVLGVEERVEAIVEHSNDLARLVVDYSVSLLVPEDRDGISTCVLRICFEV